MIKKHIKNDNFDVEFLGHSASGIKKIDPSNPELKMKDLVSANTLAQYANRKDAVDALFKWLRNGPNDPKIEKALVKMGQNLGRVLERLTNWSYWKNTEEVFIGGGLSEGVSGDILIREAKSYLSKNKENSIELKKIHYHPSVAGLIGTTYFLPQKVRGDTILAVDLGGGNLRTGLITSTPNMKETLVHYTNLLNWRTLDLDKKSLVDLIVQEVLDCLKVGKQLDIKISEYGGIAIPALLDDEGFITGKDRNLPGDWTKTDFHMPSIIENKIKERGFKPMKFIAQNDVVCQGLSELPFMQDVKEWGILTVGTGLGNARFRTHKTRF